MVEPTDPADPGAGERTRRRAAESLLAFWSGAGVDACYEADPIDRLIRRGEAPARRAPLDVAGLGRSPVPSARSPAPQTHVAASETPEADLIAAASGAAAAAADLPALALAIAAFDGCGLKHGGARQAVFSRGEPRAPLFIIGEGPGADEDARGEPFVGRAGRLLDLMLASAGLAERCFITNTVFWRPPRNRTPTPVEQRVCAPFVERAITLVRPRLLLLVGAAAARSILGAADGILALRGRWFEWTSADGTLRLPVMPTLHPAFLLRQPEAKKKAWADLLAVADRLDRGETPPYECADVKQGETIT